MRKLVVIYLIVVITLNISISVSANNGFPLTGSPSIILIDAKSGQILYDKNPHERLYPASITKVMTALLVLENCKLDQKVIASKRAVYDIEPGSNTASFQPGEELTVEQLLYALMLNSANESANILAEHVGGSIEGFADKMNARAKELGALDTHFVTPNGLHKENHYTTVYDMSLIAKQAMTIPKFRQLVSTVRYKMPDTNKYAKGDKYFLNSNRLIKPYYVKGSKSYYYSNAIGIKTGYTTKAGHSIITGAAKNDIELIAVCMNARIENGVMQTYDDSIKLFEHVFNNFALAQPIKANSFVKQVIVPNGSNQSQLNIVAKGDISFIGPNNTDQEYVVKEEINPNLAAPIKKGSVVGRLQYLSNGQMMAETELIASTSINANTPKLQSTSMSYIFNFLIILRNIIILLFVIFVSLVILAKANQRKARRHQTHLMKIEELIKD